MAGEKTEKPTPKRLQDARVKGQVSKSQDLNGAVVLLAATASMAYMGSYFITTITSQMKYAFGTLLKSPLALHPFSGTQLHELVNGTIQSLLTLLTPFLLTVMILACLINIVQVRPLFAPQAILPKWDKINPLNGFKRLFSMRSLIEVLKALFKMGCLLCASILIIQGQQQALLGLGQTQLSTAWVFILGLVGEIAKWGCILFLLAGIIDWRYQAWSFEKQLRMSRQDIRDERRNSDGDPMMKRRIRQMGAKMAKSRQLAAIPTADVVITNPTHYAIALKYDPDIAPAPVVVAKGQDHMALKIKEIAAAHNVPMVENKPLARTLYPLVEPDTMVPPSLFVAVAEVLAYVFSRNKGRRLAAQKKAQKAKEQSKPE